MWNPFKKKLPEPVGNVYELTPQAPAPKHVNLILPTVQSNVLLKRLKWVMHDGHIAIIWDFDSSGNCTLHYTDKITGETTGTGKARCSALRLATWKEIPEARRVGLTQVQAAALGYF